MRMEEIVLRWRHSTPADRRNGGTINNWHSSDFVLTPEQQIIPTGHRSELFRGNKKVRIQPHLEHLLRHPQIQVRRLLCHPKYVPVH
jgi:hypothetical protein